MNLINFFIFFKAPPKVKKEDPLKIPFKSLKARMKWDSRPKQKQDTTRVPTSSSVKRTVRYIFGASILTNFSTVYLYVKKTPFTKAQTQFTCCHTYIKLVLFRSGCSFFSGFYFYYYKKTKTRKTLVARKGEMAVIQIHWQLEILHVSCRLELSPSHFDFDFRWDL